MFEGSCPVWIAICYSMLRKMRKKEKYGKTREKGMQKGFSLHHPPLKKKGIRLVFKHKTGEKKTEKKKNGGV